MLEFTRLTVFREVARRGSFTAAAAHLGFSQPAISHQIAQLEREVGATLVERENRRVRLTPAGETLLPHVEAVLLRLADAERELAETAQVGLNRLRVAAFATAAATVVPPAAGLFRQQLPSVELALTEGDPGDTLAALHAGDHDVALAYDYPVLSRPGPDGLELEPLFVDQMCVAVPADHPLAALEAIPLHALAEQSWCAPHHSVCRDALDLVCRTAGFTPRIASETNDYMVMQGLVAARVGVAVMPRLATAIAVRPGIVVRPLLGDVLERVTFIVTRTAGYRAAAVTALRRALIESVGMLDTHGLALEPFESEPTALVDGLRR